MSDQTHMRGVNLGNWLVTERWMERKLYAGVKADDESTLLKRLGPDDFEQRMQRHRDTYVTRDTFAWMSEHGIRLVRIPIPHHLFGDATHAPSVSWLDRAFDWADEHDMVVLPDLHSVPGGQNGFDNSGLSGLCSWHVRARNIDSTYRVLERVARRYADHPALFGLELMNEPASPRIFRQNMVRYGAGHPDRVERSSIIPRRMIEDFYRTAYERLHPILGPGKAIVFHDRFQPLSWNRFMPSAIYPDAWIDSHFYVGAACSGLGLRTLPAHLAVARRMALVVRLVARYHRLVIGEWSLGNHMKGLPNRDEDARDKAYRALAQAQLSAWKQADASCFWSLRIEPGRHQDWSLEACLERGWLDW